MLFISKFKIMINNKVYKGFKKEYELIHLKDIKEVRLRLYTALKINNRNSFRFYLNGLREPKLQQAKEIREVFESYGIKCNW